MARSNRSKYAHLDYVLLGKPGKRRWHKREEMAPTKRLDVGISFLDSAAALYNRNRREIKVYKRAMSLPQQEEYKRERRRGKIRAIAYGTFVTGAVVASIYGIAKVHRLGNAHLIKEASQDLVTNLKIRARHLTDAVELTDKSIIGANMARQRGANLPPDFTGGFIDAQRRNIYNIGKMGRARMPYPATPGEINAMYDGIVDSQEQIKIMTAQLYSAIKSKDMSPMAVKYREYAKAILNRVEATDISEILKSNDAFMDIIQNNDKEFARVVRKVGNGFEMLDTVNEVANPNNPIWDKMSPDEIFSHYVAGDLGGAGSKVGFVDISSKHASQIAKGLRDDIVDAFTRRKGLISAALREGDPTTPLPGMKGKRPLFWKNTKWQATKKVAKGLGAAFNPIPTSEEGKRVAATTLAMIGTSVGAAHAGAQLANTASTAIINNIEDREQAEDSRFREALIRNRLRSEYEHRGGMRQGKVSVHPNDVKASSTSRKKVNIDNLMPNNRSTTKRKGKDMLSDVNRSLIQGSRRSR